MMSIHPIKIVKWCKDQEKANVNNIRSWPPEAIASGSPALYMTGGRILSGSEHSKQTSRLDLAERSRLERRYLE
jgi:hypothetical protein